MKSTFTRKNITITLVFLFFFIFFIHPVGGDGDYYHHLNAGKDIFLHRTLPHRDTYTFTARGKEWVNYSWLAGVIFYVIDSEFGSFGVSIFVSLMAVVTLFYFFVLLKSYRLSDYFSTGLTILLAGVLGTRWPTRPEICMYPCVILLFLIERIRLKMPRSVLLFPILIFTWSCLYGSSVIIGVVLLIIFIVRQFLRDHKKINGNQKLFYICALIALPLSLMNGYGVNSLFYIYFIREIGQTQREWFGIFKILQNASYSYLLTFQYNALIYFLYAGLFIMLIPFGRYLLKKYPLEALMASAILVPLFTFRQFSLAAIVSLPFLGIAISSYRSNARKKILKIVVGVVAVLSIFIGMWKSPPDLSVTDQYPMGLVDYLNTHDLHGNILNHPQDGGFLSYYAYPESHIFADTRDELYLHTHILEDYYQALEHQDFNLLLVTYPIDIVIGDLSQGEAYKQFFYSDSWVPVYLKSNYFIAIPRKVSTEKNLPILSYIDPFTFSQAKQGQEDLARALFQDSAQNDPTANDKLRYAYLLYSLKEYKSAIDELTQIKASQDTGNVLFNMSKTYLTGLSYLSENDCTKAAEYFDATNQGLKGIMIFTPNVHIPSPVANGYRLSSQRCSNSVQLVPGLSD